MADKISMETGLKGEVGEAAVGDTNTWAANDAKLQIALKSNTTGKSSGGLDISTLSGAEKAVDMITDAINLVSSARGDLGAVQNRLEHTANNLSVMEENIQNAESAIRPLGGGGSARRAKTERGPFWQVRTHRG